MRSRVYGGNGGKQFKFGRSNVGQRVGEGTTKNEQTASESLITKQSNSLQVYDMCKIALGQGINERERFIVNLRGFKIKYLCRNIDTRPICLNWAIVAGRSKNVILDTDLFRSAGGSVRASGISDGNGFQNTLADINTDEYVCMKHKRVFLSEGNDPTTKWNTNAKKSSWSMREFYFPLKRQLRYADNTTTSCTEKVFFIFWLTILDDITNATPTNVAQWSLQIKAYFKEPKN